MRRALLLILWLASDLILFITSYLLAYFYRVGWIFSTDLPFRNFLMVTLAVSPVWLLALVTTRTFALSRNQRTIRTGAYIAYACAVGAALVALIYYFVFASVFSRLILIAGMLLSVAALWLWHICFDAINRAMLRRDPPAYPTLIVGVTRESKKLIELMERKKHPLRPVAVLDGSGAKEKDISGVPVLGKLDKLEVTLERFGITHLIQCSDLEQSINLLSACRIRGITYMLLPSVLGIVERDERIESVEGYSVTVVSPRKRLVGWFLR